MGGKEKYVYHQLMKTVYETMEKINVQVLAKEKKKEWEYFIGNWISVLIKVYCYVSISKLPETGQDGRRDIAKKIRKDIKL